MLAEGPWAGNGVTDAQELGDAKVEAADLGHQGTHGRVAHPIHGREDQGRDPSFDPSNGTRVNTGSWPFRKSLQQRGPNAFHRRLTPRGRKYGLLDVPALAFRRVEST